MKNFLFMFLLMSAMRVSAQTMKQDTLDFKGKTISAFIVYQTILALNDKEIGESVIIKTENYKALENDLPAWGRMSGWPISMLEKDPDYLLIKIKKGLPVNKTKKMAIVISDNGLEELLSPLGLAMCCAVSGYEVNIYFQGPSVRVLTKGFKEKLPGINSIFSLFARNGLNNVGHIPAQEKLKVLQDLGANFYVCQPSMQHFGVSEKDLDFEKIILCEYLTFLEVYNTSDLKLFLQ